MTREVEFVWLPDFSPNVWAVFHEDTVLITVLIYYIDLRIRSPNMNKRCILEALFFEITYDLTNTNHTGKIKLPGDILSDLKHMCKNFSCTVI